MRVAAVERRLSGDVSWKFIGIVIEVVVRRVHRAPFGAPLLHVSLREEGFDQKEEADGAGRYLDHRFRQTRFFDDRFDLRVLRPGILLEEFVQEVDLFGREMLEIEHF